MKLFFPYGTPVAGIPQSLGRDRLPVHNVLMSAVMTMLPICLFSLLAMGCGGGDSAFPAESVASALERAKSDAPDAERLAACDEVLTHTGCTADTHPAGRIAMLVALGLKGYLRARANDPDGAEACRRKHRELAQELVARHPQDAECRSHAAQLLAFDAHYDAAWAMLLAAPVPEDALNQDHLLRGAGMVHAQNVERGEQALEIANLTPYAQVVRRLRLARAKLEPRGEKTLELLAQECVLLVRSGRRDQALPLLAEAEALSPGCMAVVRMRDTLGIPQDAPLPTPTPQSGDPHR